tara:strand:- start:145100 stop:146068 length:969 start_codon:yes stop_codon:yes gene_type:complete
MTTTENILVVKLSALGDFIQALGPMKAIRQHHPDAHITLMTTKAFAGFGKDCGYFDEIWIDEKPKWYNFTDWVDLSRRLNLANFARVYDLQNNDRTRMYFKFLRGPNRPEWVGTAKKGSHYNGSSKRTQGTAFAGHAQTLALAGINNVSIDKLEWMDTDLSLFPIESPYALIVAGCAPSRPNKRWPIENFVKIAKKLTDHNIQPVLIGSESEKDINAAIKSECAQALDLTARTNLTQIGCLARDAVLSVCNDTGPAHIIGVTGCPCYVAFSSKESNPHKHAPLGENIYKFVAEDIADIHSADIWESISNQINPKTAKTKTTK